MQYSVFHEGQTIPVPAEIGTDEQKLRRALSSIIPGIAEAKITPTVKDDQTTFTIIKTAGTKGGNPLDTLIACKGGLNPAVAYYQTIGQLDLTALSAEAATRMDAEIEQALAQGKKHYDQIEKSLNRLAASRPVAAPRVILGF